MYFEFLNVPQNFLDFSINYKRPNTVRECCSYLGFQNDINLQQKIYILYDSKSCLKILINQICLALQN